MKKEKAKTKRIGGFLLEVLVLIFVFSYSYAWSETTLEDQSDRNSPEKHAAQIVIGNFSTPALKETITKIRITGAEFIDLEFSPVLSGIAKSKICSATCLQVNLNYSNTTINAP